MKSREHQLLRLGFHLNEHQDCYILSRYDKLWYVEFWKIADYNSSQWNILIDDLIYDIQEVKKQYYNDLREHSAYKLREKEDKKQILDLLNKYRSWLQQETQCKMGRGNPNLIRETELRAKINVLEELLKTKTPTK
jgi:hypothetical protein